MPTSAELAALIRTWKDFALKASSRHSAASDLYSTRDSGLAVTSAVLASASGSAVVTSQAQLATWVKLLVGAVALIAAACAGTQATMKWGARGERHRLASRQYGAIARQIEEFMAIPPPEAELQSRIDGFRKAIDDAGANAPNVPPRIWNQTAPWEHPATPTP